MMNKKGIIVIAIMGLLIIATGIPTIVQTLDHFQNSNYAPGVVVKQAEETFHNSEYSIPIVEFKTASGQVVQVESNHEYSPAKYLNGDQVEVFYDPKDPTHADINDPFEVWSGALAVPLFGLIFILIGIFGKGRTQSQSKTL